MVKHHNFTEPCYWYINWLQELLLARLRGEAPQLHWVPVTDILIDCRNYYRLERVVKHHSFTELLLLPYWLIAGTYQLAQVVKHHSFNELLLQIYWLISGTKNHRSLSSCYWCIDWFLLPARAGGEAPQLHRVPFPDILINCRNYYWLERVVKHHSITEFLLLTYWLIAGTFTG